MRAMRQCTRVLGGSGGGGSLTWQACMPELQLVCLHLGKRVRWPAAGACGSTTAAAAGLVLVSPSPAHEGGLAAAGVGGQANHHHLRPWEQGLGVEAAAAAAGPRAAAGPPWTQRPTVPPAGRPTPLPRRRERHKRRGDAARALTLSSAARTTTTLRACTPEAFCSFCTRRANEGRATEGAGPALKAERAAIAGRGAAHAGAAAFSCAVCILALIGRPPAALQAGGVGPVVALSSACCGC